MTEPGAGSGTTPAPWMDAPAPSAATPYDRAVAARGRRDYRTCVAALRAPGAPGGSRALRLEAECLALDGNRREAAKTYERFCRRYPNHGEIDEIRSLAAAYGGRCD